MHTILLVDDDPALRGLLKQMLELGGYLVQEAEDGLDALHKIAERLPDAVVLDVMMPNMDGITVCRKLRSNVSTADLPVIMLSGKTQDYAVREGLEAGANRYICKPVSFNDLVSQVKELLPVRAAVG